MRLAYGDESISISVTCGLAFASAEEELRKVINRADSYMLKEKREKLHHTRVDSF